MEPATPRKTTRKSNAASEPGIQQAYVDYLLNHGQRPPSVFRFMKDLNLKEDDFYRHFGSFEGLERMIWKGFVTRTVQRLSADESYAGFSVREKLLAFYYTFFEELRTNRSFVLLQVERMNPLEVVPAFLKDFFQAFESYVSGLLSDGKGRGEIADRPYVDKTYPQLFNLQMGFLLKFWKADNSMGFEQTDAAIEKSVNLAFDLIGKGAVDTAFDFAKFLFQSKVK